MDVFVDQRLNVEIFDSALRHATDELNEILVAVTQTQSPLIESTHFLMVLADVPNGAVSKGLARIGWLTTDNWKTGLACWAEKSRISAPLVSIGEANLHPSSLAMLQAAEGYCSEFALSRITDSLLLLCALENLTERVGTEFSHAGIDVPAWTDELKRWIEPPRNPIPVFDDQGSLIRDSFSPSGRRVLSLMQGETEALGYTVVDSRHLLTALLLMEDGSLGYALSRQSIQKKRPQEIVTISLQAQAKKSRSVISLCRNHLQLILQRILSLSGEISARDRIDCIDEPHILRAFLMVESTARQMLADTGPNLSGIESTAEKREMTEDCETAAQSKDALAIADIDTVRDRVKRRLVGQDEAIERILPYIQRMRFGFSVPERPQGVFLFCGQSGTGKTEMAKELARAVFGTEENLVFLEMGMFNATESMNIFVGAPPGYVGYGEGKLTNGLRDKPQSVVLFDEVEKAHPRVLDALLRFLDEGRIDDPAGPVRDGSKCIVVLTSNVGAKELGALWQQIKTNPNWRTLIRKQLRQLFEKHDFRVEFLNRVDELILFRSLTDSDYTEIAKRSLQGHLDQLQTQRQIEVLTEGVYEAIGQYCASINEGARAARRLGLSMVVTPVIDYVMRSGLTPPVKVKVRAELAVGDPESEPCGVVELA